MKQLFTLELDNLSEIAQENAKRQIYNTAVEMGFPYCPYDPVIKQTKNGKYYMDWHFFTSLDQAFEDMASL